MRIPFFFLVFLISWLSNSIQAQEADSLWRDWKNAELPAVDRVKALHEFNFMKHFPNAPDSLLACAKREYAFAVENGLLYEQTEALYALAIANELLKRFDQERSTYLQIIHILLELDLEGNVIYATNNLVERDIKYGRFTQGIRSLDSVLTKIDNGSFSKLHGVVEASKGKLYFEIGDFAMAVSHFRKAQKISEQAEDYRNQALVTMGIGYVYVEIEGYTEATQYFNEAIAYYESTDDLINTIVARQAIANIFYQTGELDKAQNLYEALLAKAGGIDPVQEAYLLGSLGIIYYKQEAFRKAEQYLDSTLALLEALNQQNVIPEAYIVKGQLGIAEGNYKMAIAFCSMGLEKASLVNRLRQRRDACECLFKAHKELGETDQALHYHILLYAAEDSLAKRTSIKALQRFELENWMRADSIAGYENELRVQEAHEQEIVAEKRKQFYLLGASILVLLLAGAFYSRWRFVQKSKAAIEREKARADQLTLNITHEFKTPLTLVIGPLEQLYNKAKDLGDKALIQTAKKNAADLLYLINQLLDMNKVGKQKMSVNYSRGDFGKFVSEICDKSMALAKAKDINLVFHAEPKEIETHFDGRKTERIVINLLSNALKFAPKNSTVTVLVKAEEKTIRLQVIDEGPGIPDEEIENIFTQFYQIDGSNTRKHGGTGIGLSLVKEYADLLGADVSVKKNNSGGSTFEVVFPVMDTEHETAIAEISDSDMLAFETIESPTVQPAIKEGENAPIVLIAEDNHELNNYLKQCLEGYQVMQAFDGKEAWQLAQEHVPDLLVTDVMMPEMTGVELCKKMKQAEITSHIPVIVLTAKSAVESRVEGLTAGADDYLAKPFNQTELLVRIKNLIDLRKALRDKYASSLQSVKTDNREVDILEKENAFIKKAEQVIETNLDNGDFDVMQFCEAMGVSRAQAHRKVKALTDLSVSIYIRSYRLKRALEILQEEDVIIKEVAYRVGFNSPAYFTKCFHEQFGFPPGQFTL